MLCKTQAPVGLSVWGVECFAKPTHRAISISCWMLCKTHAPNHQYEVLNALQNPRTELSVWGVECFAKHTHRAISIGCWMFCKTDAPDYQYGVLNALQNPRTGLSIWGVECFAKPTHRAISMRCWMLCKTRVPSYQYGALNGILRALRTGLSVWGVDRDVASNEMLSKKWNVAHFKNKFFDQVRRYVRSLAWKSNCGVENYDVLEILQLKFLCMKIYIENWNACWKNVWFAEKCMFRWFSPISPKA
jgi:hypothetical protein